jgi:hypothetical protein
LDAQSISRPPANRTAEEKIADAMSAAPASIASRATIMDWPATSDGQPSQLRAGSNGWVCFPTAPRVHARHAREPFCLDEAAQAWAHAWMTKTAPQMKTIGIGYMLAGDGGASNTDPFATEKTAQNDWVESGPHVMIHVGDVGQLKDFNTDPSTGAPYVMWQGTPYAHIMIPTGAHREHQRP